MSKRNLFIIIGLPLLILGAIFVATTRWNPRTVREDNGPKPIAIRNRFLALGRFLEEQYGWNVQYSFAGNTDDEAFFELTISPLEFLKSTDGAEDPFPMSDFLLTGPGRLMPGMATPPQYQNDALLAQLGIRSLRPTDDGKTPDSLVGIPLPSATRTIKQDGAEYDVAYPRRFEIEFAEPLLPPIAGFQRSVASMEDLELLSNDLIDQADHIRVADLVFNKFNLPAGSSVHIVYGVFSPSIWQWLVTRGLCITLLTVVAVGLVLWHWLPRVGQIQADPERERRSLREHLHAGAKYLLTYRHYSVLIAAARNAVVERLRKRGVEKDSSRLIQPASQISGMPEEQVAYALSGSVDRRSILRSAQILQELQQKL